MSHLWRMSVGKFGPLLYLHWLPCAFLFYFWCPKYYQPEPRASRLFATGCQSMCCAHAGARLPSHVNMQEVNFVVSSFIFPALFFHPVIVWFLPSIFPFCHTPSLLSIVQIFLVLFYFFYLFSFSSISKY